MDAERCEWAEGDELMTEYHDNEWGVPDHDDRKLFELLTLLSKARRRDFRGVPFCTGAAATVTRSPVLRSNASRNLERRTLKSC